MILRIVFFRPTTLIPPDGAKTQNMCCHQPWEKWEGEYLALSSRKKNKPKNNTKLELNYGDL